MCQSLHLAVDACINCSFVHLYLQFYYSLDDISYFVVRIYVTSAICTLFVQFQLFLRATAYAVSAHTPSQFRPSVRLSVRPSVTRVIHAKTLVVRMDPHIENRKSS